MFDSNKSASRRRLLQAGASAALAASVAPDIIAPKRAKAQPKTLKVLTWKHFVPAYDRWFDESFAKQWGEKNGTQVIIDRAAFADLNNRAQAEVKDRQGHDLVIFITTPGRYEEQAIDHREIYEECERQYGKVADFAIKSTYNPVTNKYFGFCATYAPAVITFRKDLWDAVGVMPDGWEQVLTGGRLIKLLHDKPVGLSLAPEQNSAQTMRAIMYSFGSGEQAADGSPALKSRATLEAIKYVKALYEEAMTKEVLAWDGASNNRFMLNGEGCLTLDTLSVARASETIKLPVAKDLRPGNVPAGPVGRLAPSFGFHTHVVWSFAENIEGAKRFLVDYVASLRAAFIASGFQNMPCWPGAMPDLATVVTHDPGANPPDKYSFLAEIAAWTTNVGHPGHTNPAISEVYDSGLIPTMFARAATGQLKPEEALDEADAELRGIFQKWKENGKL